MSFHFSQTYSKRTDLTIDELFDLDFETYYPDEVIPYFEVRKKQRLYPHQIFYIWKDENLFIGYDPNTDKLCTIMYLDGRDGYADHSNGRVAYKPY